MQVKENVEKTPEHTNRLGELEPGDIFRYSHDTFEECLKTGCFYMVAKPWSSNQDKIHVVSIDGKETLLRDKDHRVVKHDAEILVRRKA